MPVLAQILSLLFVFIVGMVVGFTLASKNKLDERVQDSFNRSERDSDDYLSKQVDDLNKRQYAILRHLGISLHKSSDYQVMEHPTSGSVMDAGVKRK